MLYFFKQVNAVVVVAVAELCHIFAFSFFQQQVFSLTGVAVGEGRVLLCRNRVQSHEYINTRMKENPFAF